MNAYRKIVVALIGLFLVSLIGVLGFSFLEDLTLFEALWLTVVTVLTVGYGDIVPKTAAGRMFAIVIIPLGIGLVTYALGAVMAVIIEGEFSKTMRRRRMERAIGKLTGHIIICGLGRVGQQVVLQLQHEGVPTVIIDRDMSHVVDFDPKLLYIEGDATEDQILYRAGIERAAGLVATLPQDANNVFIALTARGINPDIHIVGRAERPESEEKLRRAGADKVINPASIGGKRMAMSILKPISVEYVDTIFENHNHDEFGVEEIRIEAGALLANTTLKESRIREVYGVTIVAIKRGDQILTNPSSDETLLPDDEVVVFGMRDQLAAFEQATKA